MKKPVLYLNTFTFDSPFPSFASNKNEDIFYTPSNLQNADIYKPKMSRGYGENKEGRCDLCNKWYKLKNSSYWYHMNYIHGISSSGVKYPDPCLKVVHGKLYGNCKKCDDWIFLGYRTGDKSSKYGWYKHCQKVHNKNKTI